jgi:uncharacterized protein (DUF58 family)
MPIPTRRLALVAVAVAAISVPFASWTLFAVGNVVLVAVALLDASLAPRPDSIAIERHVAPVVALFAKVPFTWTVHNPHGRRVQVRFADEMAPSLRAGVRGTEVRIAARSTVDVRTHCTPMRRGRFVIADLAVRVAGPLGLAARQATRHEPVVLRVHPLFPSRDEAELRVRQARVAEVGLRSTRGRGGGTDFDQLREYTPDDQFRRIDWAATARTGKAVVRDYRPERNQSVISLLDNGRVMAGRVDDVPRVEHAMDAVMMLTTLATGLGDRAGLVAFDRDVRSVVNPAPGRLQLTHVIEAMYDLDPVLSESDYRGAFAATLARFRRRSMLVLFTDLVEQAVGETLLPALPLIARHHLVVVAAVTDPDVARWAAESAHDGAEAYRKAAALSALEERRRTTAQLRAKGATVVDAPPELLATRLADTYLSVKATGAL